MKSIFELSVKRGINWEMDDLAFEYVSHMLHTNPRLRVDDIVNAIPASIKVAMTITRSVVEPDKPKPTIHSYIVFDELTAMRTEEP